MLALSLNTSTLDKTDETYSSLYLTPRNQGCRLFLVL